MSKYTIFIISVLLSISNLAGQNNGFEIDRKYIRFELPVTFQNLPTSEQTLISPFSFTNSDYRIQPKLGLDLDILFKNGFGLTGGIRFLGQGSTKNYIDENYGNKGIDILDKYLNESVRNFEISFKGYFYKDLKGNNGFSIDVIWQYSRSRLTDNIIVHAEKNPGIYVPIVEFEKYQLDEYSAGLGLNYYINTNKTLGWYFGLQAIVPFKVEFMMEETYFDDYYIYKDVKGFDLPEENTFDLKKRLRINLLAGLRFNLN